MSPRVAAVSASPAPLSDAWLATAAAGHAVDRWQPLAAPPWLARVPGAVGRFARRRAAGGVVRRAPSILALDACLRAAAGAHTDRRYHADFALRVAIDAWAAREVARTRPDVVVAPSLAARRTFAAARSIGARTVLLLDLPLLRRLHADLDRAAAVWPERAFLRRFRAPSWAIARQEAERVLADEIVVRGPYAHAICRADGLAPARLAMLPPADARRAAAPGAAPPPTGRVLLAGLAAARHGIDTALAATRALGLTLVVRAGEGTEPADLLQRAGVVAAPAPVDAILCPAICETYPPELRGAPVPVLASPQAGGTGPDPFDVPAWIAALAALTPRTARRTPP